MNYGPPPTTPTETPAPQSQPTSARLPLGKPIVTYVLLAVIVLVFIADYVLAQFFGDRIVFILGAQWNEAIGAGWYWQLFTPIFLHSGLTHVAFNGYALLVIGRDTESFYRPRWFTAVYLLAGLAGNIAWYLLGSSDPSVGASGAIFGLIGAEAAFFVRNRKLFGAFGRQRLGNVAVMLAINLFLGFTIPNINNIAHLGGLIGGFLVGFGVAPSYAVEWSQDAFIPVRRLVDRRTTVQRVIVVLAALVILLALVLLGNQRWAV